MKTLGGQPATSRSLLLLCRTCHTGQFLAKLATNTAKPKGVRVLFPRDVHSVLAVTSATKIPGCGAGTSAARYFAQSGLKSILDLRRLGIRELRERLGEQLGAKVGARMPRSVQGKSRQDPRCVGRSPWAWGKENRRAQKGGIIASVVGGCISPKGTKVSQDRGAKGFQCSCQAFPLSQTSHTRACRESTSPRLFHEWSLSQVYDRCRGIDHDPTEPKPEPSRVSSSISFVPLIKPAPCLGKPNEVRDDTAPKGPLAT